MSNKDSVVHEGQVSSPTRPSGGKLLAVLALLVGLVAGAVAARYWFQSEASQQYNSMQQQLQSELDTRNSELEGARAKADALEGKLMVEESTRKGLEAGMQTLQSELGRVRDQLAFFDQLLPPGPKGSVSIRALEVERLGPTLQYKVLLMRNAPDDALFTGSMQFMANGTQADGKEAKIILKAVMAPGMREPDTAAAEEAVDVSKFSLSFDEFQRVNGLLDLPQGFVPNSVTLNVFEDKKIRVSRTVKLPATN
ncbi:DUF6776 family protein [Pollutimonas harenae]|uniref:Uncharacterized protein n=1 Tax=Pollutimonas harenae TaxID=657015 RepID=A0A853GTF0_9BURK|nr:DUF6776 family protein [Pollutimonas harenae]NYT84056.1 hypothetical protein [Pollutimonas harenae]TEA73519.1 hypothetical protein ERD84_06350 [Pollutimonas harenae]